MKIKIGRFEIYSLMDGYFWLDGGRMFADLPKLKWQTICVPDDNNRIRLAARCYLIKGRTLTLFDTGMGNPPDPKFPKFMGASYLDFFGINQNDGNLIINLEKAGFAKEDLRFVTQSHLHLDHSGWNTYTNEEKKIVPVFPNAVYLMEDWEWRAGMNPHPRQKDSYLKENFVPLETADLDNKLRYLWRVKHDIDKWGRTKNKFQLEPGLTFIRTGGHTDGHWVALIESENKKAFLAGDLIPTHKHIVPGNLMSYDSDLNKVFGEKIKFLTKACREKWLILFDHDPDFTGGYVAKNQKGHFEFHPFEGGA
ncbi:hypothetical protein A3G55_04035 [Candidatus Giovannonibacteria bacterium RIFCSPLOWO2_12_FULL_44_25]|uniref:Metallo-beta-lactamase domain-containing protein n=4 Tax=Parcubacteria group TaxID=1794811 RepID=A0A837IKC0_9BACT|nr:MAG: hypothetical protein UW15_C0005G0021 [Parcubacteria group bacterium GW2011_GWC1_44_10]KKT57001.1 MAG: hypothetical protein UW49_C0009G0022 [Candidatus Giovannonibacteria bacterium GW2011_GWB1_44_23]KKT59612.1 MAG: hypothetical protein UW53_C0010G0022 [Candidatus Giovannonibacteria bacterium GW2011_GWA1_44_25]KKU12518.1 MAG: hypothetical protein UX18_C0021G0014 [Candidatus Azambacteria bacterium GW2011_GWC2_45_7b]OGF49842.1 MAG: hypothetical protein A2120_01320 [Candidatus Giovannonibact